MLWALTLSWATMPSMMEASSPEPALSVLVGSVSMCTPCCGWNSATGTCPAASATCTGFVWSYVVLHRKGEQQGGGKGVI